MRKLKVFGGSLDGRNRVICACYSLKNFADICKKLEINVSYYYIKDYCCETGNNEEIKIATQNPFALISLEFMIKKVLQIIKEKN